MNTTTSDGAGILSCAPHGVLPLGVSKRNCLSHQSLVLPGREGGSGIETSSHPRQSA